MASKKVHAVLSAGYVVFQAGTPLIAYAQSAGHELDLGSQNKNITAGSEFHDLTINLDNGSSQKTFASGDLLTPAEFVALTQVLSGGAMAQTLNVASNGTALGGTFNLSTFASSAASIHIPQGVIGVSDAALGAINLSGNLSNSGTLYAISSNSNITSAVFSANNIFNNQGALFSSLLPSTGLSGYTSVVSNLSLSLNAISDIINAGMISSAGALNLSAGGSIVNALPAGAVGVQPILQALGNVNMISAQLANAGMVNSLAGNINVNSHIAQSILINNVGGTLSALNGALNVRDASFDTGKFNLDIVGGDVLSKELNLFSANGKINIDVNEITGRINTESFELAVAANTPAIRMGNVVVTGDPIISNGSGDVIIEPDAETAPAFLTNGGPLFVTAARNILSTAAIIDSGGGQIVFTAGGSIFLTSTSLITSGNGGHIVMIAQNGSITLSPAGTVSSGGYIQLSATGDVNTGNLVTLNGGGVVIESGGNTSTGNISTAAQFGGGSVDIRTQMTNGGSETFFIGPPGEDGRHINGVNGTITTTASLLSGFLSVKNGGLGGINVLSPDSIAVSGPGYGGEIALDAGAGNLLIGQGILSSEGGQYAGNIFLKGDSIIMHNATISANAAGGAAAGIFTSSAVLQHTGDVTLTASGASGGGIQILSANSMEITTQHDQGTGLQRLVVSGQSSGEDLTVTGTSGSHFSGFALGTETGGFIAVDCGNLNLSGGSFNLDASGVETGAAGDISVYVQGNLTNETGSSVLTASGDTSGNGGVVDVFVSGDLRVGASSGDLTIIANSGTTAGNGGSAFITSDGEISGSTSGISVATLGANGNGGRIGLYGSSLSIDAGTGFNADGQGSGNGGYIELSASGPDNDIVFSSGSGSYQASARGGSDGGSGGTVIANASRNIVVADGSIDVSAGTDGFGGVVSLAAGNGGSGEIQVNGDLNASGDAGGGLIFFQANDVSIGSSAKVNTKATGGTGGQVLFIGSDNMSVENKGLIDVSGSVAKNTGSISYSSTGSVTVTGSGEQKGYVDATGSSVDIQSSKAGTTLELRHVSSTSGFTKVNLSGAGSTLKIADEGTISASGGQLSLGANNIQFGQSSMLSMDSEGLMLLDSGSLSNSLNVILPSGGQARIQIGGGGGARPGAVLFTARNGDNVSFSTDGGPGSLDVAGGTLSASTTTGNIAIGSEVSLSTDAYDELLDLGLELQAGTGSITVSGDLSASNLKLTTTEGGSITLGSDLNAPTIAISTSGAGTINQTNGSSIGIGSLSLFSEIGNIGSASAALKTNVLEVKVSSGGDVFIDNDSSLDLKTSDVNGRFEVTTNGDLAVESNVNAETLSFTANGGSLSVMSTVESQGNATLAAAGDDTNVSITGTLRSIGGSVTVNTSSLAIDGGNVLAGGGVNINGGESLAVTGEGSITATGSASDVTLTAGSTLDIANSISMSAGSNGTVRLTAAGGETTGSITIGSGGTSTLTIGSQSSLVLSASVITLANGSTISSNKSEGTAVSMTPGVSGSLTVVLPASAGGGINTAGGGVVIASGTNFSLVFDNGGQLLDTDFTVSGGTLTTHSSSGDTTLNGVNIVSNGNVNVNVHNGSLNMGGDISSSMAGGTISILDPNGITVAGNGNISFVSGGYGQIIFAASGAGNDLAFSGEHAIDPGNQGSVLLRSDAGIVFGANSATNILNGATTVQATNVQFQSGSTLNSTASIGFTSNSSGGLTVEVPSGGQASVTSAGSITFASSTGTAINFVNSGSDSALLAFAGAPVSIQTSNANVTVGAGVVLRSEQNLTISTPGGTLVNNGRLEIPVQSSTITIEASGNLYVNENVSAKNIIVRTLSNNGNITLSSDLTAEDTLRVSAHGSGNIYQEEGLLTAGLLILESGSGNIGTKNGGAIRFTANNLEVSTNGSARLESVGAVTVQSASVGGTLNLKSSGTVTISGGSGIAVGANKLVINSQRDIIVNSDVSANKVVLKTHNQGGIRGSATIRGDEVRLKTEKGNIGSASNYLRTAAAELRIDTGKNASAFISELNSVELSKVSVGGSFYLTAGGNLSVNNVDADNGSVSLTASGNIHLLDHSKIRVDEGNIVIRSTNQTSGFIRIGEHSTIEAYASKAPLGNVSIIIGEDGSPVKGSAPKNVSVSKKWGGEVYFGKKGITAEGKKNEINAWGSNVTFSTGSRPASAIILEGNVRITADPPPSPTEEMQAPVSLVLPLAQPSSTLPSLALPLVQTPFNAILVPTRSEAVTVPQESVPKDKPSPKLLPVSYLHGAATINTKTPLPNVSLTDAAFIKQSDGCMSVCSDGALAMRDGEAVVHARRPMRVTAEGSSVFLQPGSVVLLKKDGKNINVFNLFEANSGAVKVSVMDSKPTVVRVGSSFSVGSSMVSIATRRAEHHEVDGTPVHYGEFSLLSLASNTTMLTGLLNSKNDVERRLASRLLKMAAALSMVTSGHGAYVPPKP